MKDGSPEQTYQQAIKKINAIASFTTQPQNQHISIYSTYEMDITLSAKFKKTLGN